MALTKPFSPVTVGLSGSSGSEEVKSERVTKLLSTAWGEVGSMNTGLPSMLLGLLPVLVITTSTLVPVDTTVVSGKAGVNLLDFGFAGAFGGGAFDFAFRLVCLRGI